MLGWSRAATAWASRWKRARAAGSSAWSAGSTLSATCRAELEVLAEVDGAHAAGADPVEDEVLADEEFRPAAAHQVLGLERREEAVADEEGGQVARPARQGGGRAQAGEVRGQPGRVQRQALLNQVEQIVGGGRRGHCDHPRHYKKRRRPPTAASPRADLRP